MKEDKGNRDTPRSRVSNKTYRKEYDRIFGNKVTSQGVAQSGQSSRFGNEKP